MTTTNAQDKGPKVIIGILLVALIVFAGIVIKDGVPGVLIIVVQPDPDDREKDGTLTTLGYIAHWYVGCPPKPDEVRPIKNEDSPVIAHRLNGWVHVGEIAVIVKQGVDPIDPSEIGGIELTLDSHVLALTIEKKNAKPKWTFGGKEIKGEFNRDMLDFSSQLLGDIKALKVTGFKGTDLTPKGGIADVKEIRISHNKFWLYNDCE